MATTTNYGWTYPTVNADSGTWGGILNTAIQAIDTSLKTVSDASKVASNLSSGVVPSARGGAGTVSGIMKANGSGTVSAATASVDYCPASSGSSILYGNGSGGLSNVTIGTGLTFSGGTISTRGQTVSTSTPSGTPTDGDTWLQYSA